MRLLIGENIKALRKENNLTQEELAEIFNVSCQSVSRWELGTCYPDMELLPTMADFFHVTVDKLLGVNETLEQTKIDQYLERFQDTISKGLIDDCIAIAREGVAEFPNNFALLNNLMYALFASGDETGNITDWKENFEKYDEEITTLGERIIKYCPDQDIRLEATARLAFNHCEHGRKEQGRAIYATLPSRRFCRENHIWYALNDKEKINHAREQIEQGYGTIRNAITNLGNIYEPDDTPLLTDQEMVAAYAKIPQLGKLIFEDAYETELQYSYDAIWLCHFARTYARLGKFTECLEQLEIAAKTAIAFDNRPESKTVSSLLVGERKYCRSDFDTADSRSCCQILKEKWMAHKDFDCVRNTAAFQEILDML